MLSATAVLTAHYLPLTTNVLLPTAHYLLSTRYRELNAAGGADHRRSVGAIASQRSGSTRGSAAWAQDNPRRTRSSEQGARCVPHLSRDLASASASAPVGELGEVKAEAEGALKDLKQQARPPHAFLGKS